MKKVSKAILIGLTILVALGVALVVGLNLYIQSPGSQARIQEELSKALRLPLKLTNVSVSPFGDLRITGITIPNGGANFLEATSFNAHYRLLPILQGKLEITEMSVENPKIIWAQTADKKWKLPAPEQAKEVSAEDANQKLAKEEKKGESANGQPGEKKPAEEVEKVAAEKKSKFVVAVDRFEVKGGQAELFDNENKHLAVLSDVNMVYTSLTPDHIEGTATIGKLVYADGATFENVSTPFSFAGGAFDLSQIDATFAGGKVQGKYHTHNEGEHSPFKIAVNFLQVNLDQLGRQWGTDPGQMLGTLSGQAEIHGDYQRKNRYDGVGRVDIRDAQFHQLDLFQNIGQIIGLKELSDLRVRDGHSDLRLSGEKVYVDTLALNTADLQLTAHGMVRLDKRLNLDAQLSVEEAVAQHLPAMIHDSFTPIEGGRRAIDFVINGTTDKPKTNLLNKLIGQKIDNQFGNVLNSIFGDKKQEDDKARKEDKDKEKKKKKDKEAPGTPAPTAAPEPASPAPAPAAPQPAPVTPQPQPTTPNP
ncbi:AsmA family protein [Chthoniobacter flavus]|uniref:AsmA-like C-terminal region-containing protein n=1 Tax=Chthoniobacter flavus TaxID=191863 RepID=UPI000679D0DC|nr:AsmA-like C-terminal region-containing protein [Chthoniobacter flavus]